MSNRPDVDTIDNILGDAVRLSVGTLTQIIGAITLVCIIQPYFLIAVTLGGDLLPAECP